MNKCNKYIVTVDYVNDDLGCTKWLDFEKPCNLHRLEGPAFEDTNGTKFWYVNGRLHRLDGPACEYASGKNSHYIDGEYYTPEDFIKEVARRNAPPLPPDPCNGKIVEIEGKKYQLKLVE
jgi:hypothetical protein